MVNRMQFYIDGAWVDPAIMKTTPIVTPATAEEMYEIALGSKTDVDKAVIAARRAFATFSRTTREQRMGLLQNILEIFKTRAKEIGYSISDEIGAPLVMAEQNQASSAIAHLATTLNVLQNYSFEERIDSTLVVREPIGVVGMITP
ncbi:acyl-CoA reductase-like NAD-dependent aldehyde dehydrogenase [Bradyrhizobium sp. USDA 3315]